MSKINKALTKYKQMAKAKALNKVTKAGIVGSIFMLVASNPAAAAEVNWSEITTVIDGFVGIVPSFAAMVSAVMPVLLIISLYVFVMRFWDKILEGIDSAFHFHK
jgi:hypothetical protein